MTTSRSIPRAAALALAAALLAAAAPASGAEAPLSEADREQILGYLDETRDLFVAELDGLSPDQLAFRPGEDRWSIAQIAEHLALAEGLVVGRLRGELLGAEPHPEWLGPDGPLVKDTMIRLAVANRTTLRLQAPPPIAPSGRYATAEAAAAALAAARAETLAFLSAADRDLRSRFLLNPVLGMLDGGQWLVFIGAHVERHTAQAREVKAHPGFPG